MNGMDQERFEDLKDVGVLGALPEEERLEFEQYLAAHPDLQVEIEELSTIAGLLAFSVRELEPPQELRRRIMSTVEGRRYSLIQAAVGLGSPGYGRHWESETSRLLARPCS